MNHFLSDPKLTLTIVYSEPARNILQCNFRQARNTQGDTIGLLQYQRLYILFLQSLWYSFYSHSLLFIKIITGEIMTPV
jgi:hypothetical protein